ncbi:MAG: hypothetical protein U9N73_04970, partial [Candidatus Auribacterota bacterium]|nr:hypothetical protein [Candidatus Auribacterota bacterium]
MTEETTDSKQTKSEGEALDINKILEYLPHRYPFLLVDRVTLIEEGKRI